MNYTPKRPTGIIHPHIEDIYLKQNVSEHDLSDNILVIKTQNNNAAVMGLLADLKSIQEKAEKQLGQIDRVDLTVH